MKLGHPKQKERLSDGEWLCQLSWVGEEASDTQTMSIEL